MNAPAETTSTAAATKESTAAATKESTAAATKESALALFIKALGPNHKSNKTDQKAAALAFKAFQAKKKTALDALKALEKEEGEVARAMLRAFGKEKLCVDGVDFVPTSRDERIYYKEMSGKGIEI